ncbi:MAG TPA: hypothetical protein VE714_01140 [Gemmatimonadales bacterium]|nr:hypothetical protein [Gemmatimonadales bacterium]
MAGKGRTWVWVIVGVVVCGILGLVAMAAAGLWFAKTHIDIRSASPLTVSEDFARVRRQFASQKPLIELDDRGHLTRTNTDRPAGTHRPESLNIMAFDPDDEKVVRMDIPFWLLRLKMQGTRFSVGNDAIDLHELHLTVEDLERFGPTLIVDHKGRGGERVLVWSQ